MWVNAREMAGESWYEQYIYPYSKELGKLGMIMMVLLQVNVLYHVSGTGLSTAMFRLTSATGLTLRGLARQCMCTTPT